MGPTLIFAYVLFWGPKSCETKAPQNDLQPYTCLKPYTLNPIKPQDLKLKPHKTPSPKLLSLKP